MIGAPRQSRSNSTLDNPEAIFRALLADPDFAELRHIWVLERTSGSSFRAEFAGNRRVRFVRPRTASYLRALARSQSLITNATFPPEFQKRPGQTVVNAWHGTPLKRMGYDMPDGAYEAARVSGPTGPAAQYERLASGMLA